MKNDFRTWDTCKQHFLLIGVACLLSTSWNAKAEDESSLSWLKGSIIIESSYRNYTYDRMNETYTFNPVLETFSEEQLSRMSEWTRRWQEEYLIVTPACILPLHEHVSLKLGLNSGVCRSQFNAQTSTDTSYTSETWDMNHSFTWGTKVDIFIAPDEARGPYINLCYNMFQSSDDEDRETLESNLNTGTDGRDAYFRWKSEHYEISTGWRFRKFTPVAGVRITDFQLRKWLTHHIDPSTAQNPIQRNLIELLNSEPSSYHYRNREQATPFIGFKYHPTEKTAFEISASIDDGDQYTAALSVVF